jgi:hypothetical protein
MWCSIGNCCVISMRSRGATLPPDLPTYARSAYIEGGFARWVHCVLLGSLLTTLAVQPSRCRRFIGHCLLPLNMHLARLRIGQTETMKRRCESLAFDLENRNTISRKTKQICDESFHDFGFAILDFLKCRIFPICFFAFCGDRSVRPPPQGRVAEWHQKKVRVISARRWPARRRRPAHTCLLPPKLHAVDASPLKLRGLPH